MTNDVRMCLGGVLQVDSVHSAAFLYMCVVYLQFIVCGCNE